MKMVKKRIIKNPVCVIYWRDAYYALEKEFPGESPELQIAAGFIMFATDDYTNIATNVHYDRGTKTLRPTDGLVIPKKAIVEFRKIGNLEHE